MSSQHRVVIIGGGFAGLNAAIALKDAPAQVTLIDRRNFHLFQPLLYQVASGALSPANIASPLREILRKQQNARVVLGDVTGIAPVNKAVLLPEGEIPYDTLIVASGAGHSYFGNDHWQPHAPSLKTIEDATEIRQRLFIAFEAAERATSPEEIRRLLTFVIVGGGPTGVELAGALGEITRDTFRGSFRHINPADATIYLVEHADRILPPFHASLGKKAADSLAELGVQVRTGTLVTDIRGDAVVVSKDGKVEEIQTSTVIWAAGVKASPLGTILHEATGVALDRQGRVTVSDHLNLPNFAEIFVVGDLAHCKTKDGSPLPGVAPVAMQQGTYVGRQVASRLMGRPARPFRYRDLGSMATIGRGRAVVDIHGFRFAGFMAWTAWLLIHMLKLVGFHNKAMVCMEWGWCYLTRNRSARLITGFGNRGALPPALVNPKP